MAWNEPQGIRIVPTTLAIWHLVLVGLVLAGLLVVAISIQSVLMGLAVLVLAAIFWFFLRVRIGTALRWHPPDVQIPTWPLALGSATPMTVTRRAKGPVPTGEGRLRIHVECKETVRYRVGTNTRTETATVYAWDGEGTATVQGGTMVAELLVPIPTSHGAPTLDLADNDIEWRLSVDRIDGPLPKAGFGIDLTVAPVLDPRLRNIQDAPPEPT